MKQPSFKIEKNIPMPEGKAIYFKLPFREMKVGDSFSVPIEHRSRIASSASIFGTRNNVKFSIFKDGDKFRCWRVK